MLSVHTGKSLHCFTDVARTKTVHVLHNGVLHNGILHNGTLQNGVLHNGKILLMPVWCWVVPT